MPGQSQGACPSWGPNSIFAPSTEFSRNFCTHCLVCTGTNQWSRLKRSYGFHFEGLALQLKGWFKSKTSFQEYKKRNKKLTLKLCMNYRVHVLSTRWRIKNNHLTPLLVVTMPYACCFLLLVDYIEDFKWSLHFQFGLRFEGLFWERYILKCQITFEGHWRLQSWTPAPMIRDYW